MVSIRGSKYIIGTDAKVNINQLKAPQCANKSFSESALRNLPMLHSSVCIYA